MSALSTPIEIFSSYADTDESLCIELENHLSQLKRDGLLISFHKRLVVAGQDRMQVIDKHLNTASVILLLISSDFLASDYCDSVEVRRAMERYEAGDACVIPILLRPVDWQSAPFAKLAALPSNGKPITTWPNRDRAFTDVAKGIRVALQDLQRLAVNTPSTTFPRIWNVPYARNPMFTGRDDLLKHLSTQLQAGEISAHSQPQAISGLGGIGKTQVAIEYAYQHARDYQAVLWCLADTQESLVSGYVTIAGVLNLPEKDEQDQTRTVQAVIRWLTTRTGWLLILDNVDDLTLVNAFIPPQFGGHLLLTTRAQATGSRIHGIELDTMPQDIGALFLLRRAKHLPIDAALSNATTADIALATQICDELGGLPLALDQAGAYVEETQCGLSNYLNLYHTQRAEMLKERGSAVDYPESVATTWILSFKKVEQQNPAAADLLRLLAYLSPDAIPEELLRIGAPFLGPVLSPIVTNPLLLNRVVKVLLGYSLIRRHSEEKTLSVRRLVQAVIRDGMDDEMQKSWMQRAVQAVNQVFPEVQFEAWTRCERYLPHALLSATWIEQRQMVLPEATHLLNEVGRYLQERGRYTQAEPFLQRALLIRLQTLGSLHPASILSFNNLAMLYEKLGRYAEAEPLLQYALTIRKQLLGPDHPDTLLSGNNLALLSEKRGKYDEAEALWQEVLLRTEQSKESKPRDLALILHNLAKLRIRQGKYTQAEPLLKRAQTLMEQQSGTEQPLMASILHNLAALYLEQGKYTEAEQFARGALSMRSRILEDDHPETAMSLNTLARAYECQGRYEKARATYKAILEIYERTLGVDHPETAAILNNLAEVSTKLNDHTQTEALRHRALTIRKRVFGPSHPAVAETLNNLGAYYHQRQRYSDAETSLQQALVIYESHFGPEHPHTAKILNNLADLYRDQGKYELAEPLYQQILVSSSQSDPGRATYLNNLALLYQAQGKYEQAEPMYQQALSIHEQQLGPLHPLVALSLNNLGLLCFNQQKYELAEPLYMRAISICEQVLGPEHLDIARSLHNLAMLYLAQGKFDLAEPLLQRTLKINEQQLGEAHPNTVNTLSNLAAIYDKQGKYEQAEMLLLRALSIFEDHLGSDHPDCAYLLHGLAVIYDHQGMHDQAEAFYQRALAHREHHLGSAHPDTELSHQAYTAFLRRLGREASATVLSTDHTPPEDD